MFDGSMLILCNVNRSRNQVISYSTAGHSISHSTAVIMHCIALLMAMTMRSVLEMLGGMVLLSVGRSVCMRWVTMLCGIRTCMLHRVLVLVAMMMLVFVAVIVVCCVSELLAEV